MEQGIPEAKLPIRNYVLYTASVYVCVHARACVWVRNRDRGNILGEYFKFARTVRVLVPMHRVAPHYCIVALECLISCLGAPDKARYYTVKRWSTYNSELFIFLDARVGRPCYRCAVFWNFMSLRESWSLHEIFRTGPESARSSFADLSRHRCRIRRRILSKRNLPTIATNECDQKSVI